MAHTLSFSTPSTGFQLPETIRLNNSVDYFIIQYVPTTPKRNADGTYEPITETIDVMFVGSTPAAMRENINRLEKFLHAARNRSLSEAGVRHYFHFMPDGDLTGYRSELIDGRVELGVNALRAYGQAKIEGRIIITRQPYWEGALREARLSSALDSTMTTGGRRIRNHKDNTNGNYVTIDNGDITGVLPAACKLGLKNSTGVDQGYRNWYIATNVWNDPLRWPITVEGENRRSGYGSIVTFSGCSNGQYVELPVNTSSSILWDLGGSMAKQAGGHTFRLLMRLASVPPVNVYVTAAIYEKTGAIPLSGYRSEVTITSTTSRLVDLGTLQIPPGLGNTSDQAGIVFRLDVRSDSSTLLNIDFIQLFPTTALRHLVQRGNLVVNGETIVDDGIEELVYTEEASEKQALYTQLESPVTVWPGRHQRLYILHDTAAGGMAIDNVTTVTLSYRPRVMTL